MNTDALNNISIDKSIDRVFYLTIEALKEAINDWPKEAETLEDFLQQVESFLESACITEDIINKKLATLNPMHDAWRMESLASLQTILGKDNNANLEQIIEDIIQKLA